MDETELERVQRHMVECEGIIRSQRNVLANHTLTPAERRLYQDSIERMERLLYRYHLRREGLLRAQT
jgi:hypothetical protein